MKEAEFDSLASGHYARVRRILTSDGNKKERTELSLCADQVCDTLTALQFHILSHFGEYLCMDSQIYPKCFLNLFKLVLGALNFLRSLRAMSKPSYCMRNVNFRTKMKSTLSNC